MQGIIFEDYREWEGHLHEVAVCIDKKVHILCNNESGEYGDPEIIIAPCDGSCSNLEVEISPSAEKLVERFLKAGGKDPLKINPPRRNRRGKNRVGMFIVGKRRFSQRLVAIH